MKILVAVHNFLSPSMTFIYNQIKALEQNRDSIYVIASERNNKELFPYNNLKIIPYSKKDIGYIFSLILRKLRLAYGGINLGYRRSFTQFLESYKPDILHIHFGLQLVRLKSIINKYNIKTVVTFHGYDASQLLRNKIYVKELIETFENPNVWGTTVSANMKNRLIAHGLPADKLIVDYLGVDTDFFLISEHHTKPHDIATFLQVSNFIEKKGHRYTIEAFAQFLQNKTEHSFRLILAGSGPLLNEMKEFSKNLGMEKYISFPGFVDKHQVKDLMNQAHYFVHHSIVAENGDSEGIPTVIMEAMAMGLPIVSTFHSGIPELVRNNQEGILVEEKNIKSYSEAFSNILKYDSPRPQSRNRVTEKFNLLKNTKNIEHIFRSL